MSTPFDPEKFKSAQKKAWTDSAEGWHAGLAASLVPVSQRLIAYTGIPSGSRVLDLACGDGSLSLMAAQAGAGEVIASDVAPSMGAIVERRAEKAGVKKKVSFREADIENLPFEEKSFDIVLCQFGLMFSPTRKKALQEIYRVLKPQGKFGAAVWCTAQENPAVAPIFQILVDHMPSRPEGTPSIFGCGEPKLMQNELQAVGFREFQETRIDVVFQHEGALAAWTAWRNNGPFAAAFATWTPDVQKEVEHQVREVHARYKDTQGKIEMPAKALLFTGKRGFETLAL
jgi:ubiquinone/menaquinone biosynthesis C-methylase UbiE